jgi:hypothetical protein
MLAFHYGMRNSYKILVAKPHNLGNLDICERTTLNGYQRMQRCGMDLNGSG